MIRVIILIMGLIVALPAADEVKIIKDPRPTCVEKEYRRLVKIKELKEVKVRVVDTYPLESMKDRSFFKPDHHIDVAGNGEVFICSPNDSSVKRYDSKGRLIAEFGKPGQGPGDLLSPHCIKVTGKKVYIADRPSNHKVSVFSRDGEFIRVISTQHNVNQIACPSDDHLAYTSIDYAYDRASGGWMETHVVRVMNLQNGREIELCSNSMRSTRISIRLSKRMVSVSLPGRPFGDVLITATPGGTILVGETTSELIAEYDVEGNKLGSFPHGLPAKAVPGKLIGFYRQSLAIPRGDESVQKEFKKALRRAVVLKEYLPFYHSMIVDRSNRLYILADTGELNQHAQPCYIYDSNRKPVALIILVAESGMTFDFAWWGKSDRIRFQKMRAFALVNISDDGDEYIRLVKVNL